MINLDTHVLIYALIGQLLPKEEELLKERRWTISAIVLWELAKLAQLNRLDIDLDDPGIVRIVSRLQVWPIDFSIARALTKLDFGSDPADEIIAATSVVHKVPLLTRDETIRGSQIVPLAL